MYRGDASPLGSPPTPLEYGAAGDLAHSKKGGEKRVKELEDKQKGALKIGRDAHLGVDPPDVESPAPPTVLPDVQLLHLIHRAGHLSDAAEASRGVDREEEEDSSHSRQTRHFTTFGRLRGVVIGEL